MIVCLPVKNGWQLPQTSTRSSVRVEPTVHSVPQDPQWTVAWWYLGWMSGFTGALLDAVRAGSRCPAGGRRSSFRSGLGGRGVLDREDPDALLGPRRALEPDLAGLGREDGVVVAQAGPLAGQEGHDALPDDDRGGRDHLAVTGLDPEALADAVAAVLRGSAGLLVGHLVYSSFFVARGRLGFSVVGSAAASGAGSAQ